MNPNISIYSSVIFGNSYPLGDFIFYFQDIFLFMQWIIAWKYFQHLLEIVTKCKTNVPHLWDYV